MTGHDDDGQVRETTEHGLEEFLVAGAGERQVKQQAGRLRVPEVRHKGGRGGVGGDMACLRLIVMADVNTYSAAAPKQPAPVTPAPQPQVAPAAPAPAAIPGDTRKPLTRIRQTIAQRMTNSKTTVPHFYITVAVEMDAALKLREQVNEALKSENIKVSVNDLVVRATAVALRRFPNLNSSFAGDAIVQHEQVHVGVAVALPSGLVTVTVRDADVKTLRQIAVEMSGLAARARDGKAQPGDMGGQTFTIDQRAAR